MSWWQAFLLTQAIELPIYAWFTRHSEVSLTRRLGVGFGCSALTHPIVWFVWSPLLQPWVGFWGFFFVAETFAVVAEASYLRAFDLSRPWSAAWVANATSASIGLLIYAWL